MTLNTIRSLRGNNADSSRRLFACAAAGDMAAFERYLVGGKNINAKDEDGLALIHYAACYGNIPLICELNEQGANMNLPDGGNPPWKPIHYTIFHRKHEAEQLLRILGAEVPLPILKQSLREETAAQESGNWAAKSRSTSTAWCQR